ncbi:hypothetical protein RDWZM_007479 [Blomia tropicalis]|uniref:Blo t allergen n=1 Tax=Blomia tropicalis TaxID=40697 RepID=A0A9Q0LZY4_BLOTA|nr:hypothetical protein RDWZM_007479 [Blomia tropicalis]
MIAFATILVVMKFSTVYGIPNPYYLHQQCSVPKLNISQLAGEWTALYHKNNHTKVLTTTFSKVNDNTLMATMKEGDQIVRTFNLTQRESMPGMLEELINKGSFTIGVPTFVLKFDPENNYVTLYNGKEDLSDEWAIYGRTKSTLCERCYNDAVQGLECAGLMKNGSPQLFKLY